MVSCGAGLALGLSASVLATRSLRSMLFEVAATDPLTYAVAAIVLTTVAGASYVPSRRATRIETTRALAAE